MCLAVPMKLIKKGELHGVVELSGVRRQVNLMLVPHAKLGDYLIVHAGSAIEILDEIEAQKTIAIFREMWEMENQQ